MLAAKVPTCTWVRQDCQRQLDDLDRFKVKDSLNRINPKMTDKSSGGRGGYTDKAEFQR